jgi:DNA polymerase III delta prime subunit
MLIGHEKTAAHLKELAAKGVFSHGYIFHGPAMVGKRTTALALAHFLEKQTFVSPAEGEVLQDAKVIDLAFMKQIKPEAKDSLGIDAVRTIKEFLFQKPNTSIRRTAIIDDGDFLSPEAQNAILKIAEEPPPSSLIILIATDIDGLLPTISSRLQKIYFGTVPEREIVGWLIKERGTTKKIAEDTARRSFGKPGFALRLLEDKEFQATLKSAEQLLILSQDKRRDFIKKLLENEEFSVLEFIDALTICLANRGFKEKIDISRWHKTLALRQNQANFNLNPKLQMENLFITNEA